MKILNLLAAIALVIVVGQTANAQQFVLLSESPVKASIPTSGSSGTGSGHVSAPGVVLSGRLKESSEVSEHFLTWEVKGNPNSCSIAMVSKMQVTPTSTTPPSLSPPTGWYYLGEPQECTKANSYDLLVPTTNTNKIPAELMIIVTGFVGSKDVSLQYGYAGNPEIAGVFALLQPWAKLDSLRTIEAFNHGISHIERCRLNLTPKTPPAPTADEFAAYSEPFGANFDLAASFGDTGSEGVPSAQGSIQTNALAQVQFESEHFGYNWSACVSHSPTFSFGGTVGFRPALVLENLSSTTKTVSNPNLRPMFQDAFGWSLSPKVNFATSHYSQLDFSATIGENYLVSQVTSFKQGDDTITATPITNKDGQSATFWEAAARWKLLGTDVVNAYVNKTDLLDPPFTISVGYRQDQRFRRAGDLPSTYVSPESYVFFRFGIGLNTILNWNDKEVKPGKGYTFKFGVDYERPIREGRMPTATRYYVSANIDLMKVFKPTTQQPASAPSGGTAGGGANPAPNNSGGGGGGFGKLPQAPLLN